MVKLWKVKKKNVNQDIGINHTSEHQMLNNAKLLLFK